MDMILVSNFAAHILYIKGGACHLSVTISKFSPLNWARIHNRNQGDNSRHDAWCLYLQLALWNSLVLCCPFLNHPHMPVFATRLREHGAKETVEQWQQWWRQDRRALHCIFCKGNHGIYISAIFCVVYYPSTTYDWSEEHWWQNQNTSFLVLCLPG